MLTQQISCQVIHTIMEFDEIRFPKVSVSSALHSSDILALCLDTPGSLRPIRILWSSLTITRFKIVTPEARDNPKRATSGCSRNFITFSLFPLLSFWIISLRATSNASDILHRKMSKKLLLCATYLVLLLNRHPHPNSKKSQGKFSHMPPIAADPNIIAAY